MVTYKANRIDELKSRVACAASDAGLEVGANYPRLVRTWRTSETATVYHFRVDASARHDMVVKLLDTPEHASALFHSMTETARALEEFAWEQSAVLRPLGLSEDLGAVIMPHVSGRPLSHLLQRESWSPQLLNDSLLKLIRGCGILLAGYHTQLADNSEPRAQAAWADLQPRIASVLGRQDDVRRLAERGTVAKCHGDFQPDNIIVTDANKLALIDPRRGDLEERAAMLLSLSREERAEAVMELQRRYGNHRVQRVLARLVQPDAAEEPSEDPNQVSQETTSRIEAQQGTGRPLDTETRTEMESAFGHDFSDVRVHTGAEADALNREVQARAFTTGADIFFRDGTYAPGSSQGKELLAHELTHVVQQSNAPAASSGPARVTSPDDASEVEAARVAQSVVHQVDIARQPVEEEEELQMARQPVEEEEELQMARQVEEEEELQMARQPQEVARQAEGEDFKADEKRWVELMESIASGAEGKKPKQKKEYEEAIKTTGKALLETGTGKELKEQAKQFLLSKKGAPLTLTLGAGGLAAIIATKAEIPSVPIPLSENMELTIDVKGPLAKPEGVMATFKMNF